MKKAFRRMGTVLGVAFLIFCYFLWLNVSGNFHTVIPGQLYRAAQISGDDVDYYAKNYHIRSIINLRGHGKKQEWYVSEVAASKANNIQHYDFHMSARQVLSESDARSLLQLMQDVPKPLLIHCNAGADRSGLAAALYLLVVEHSDEELAERQLFPFYGHLPLPFIQEFAMDRSFEKLAPALAGVED